MALLDKLVEPQRRGLNNPRPRRSAVTAFALTTLFVTAALAIAVAVVAALWLIRSSPALWRAQSMRPTWWRRAT